MDDDRDAVFRIGEVARRTGVSVATLRAWERRYDLLDPDRTDGGHRLYADADVHRVEAMQQRLAQGWSASAAARDVRSAVATRAPAIDTGTSSPAAALTDELEAALDAFDAGRADLALDDAFARLSLPAALDEVIMPAMRWVGDGWQDDPRVIAREHVATNAIRPRLLRLLRTATPVAGHVCVAATPEDEEHDLGLLAASAVAAISGWRVHFLGSRTPRAALERACSELRPEIVMVAATYADRATTFLDDPLDIGEASLVVGGAGFEGLQPTGERRFVHTGSYRDLPGVLAAAVDQASTT